MYYCEIGTRLCKKKTSQNIIRISLDYEHMNRIMQMYYNILNSAVNTTYQPIFVDEYPQRIAGGHQDIHPQVTFESIQ